MSSTHNYKLLKQHHNSQLKEANLKPRTLQCYNNKLALFLHYSSLTLTRLSHLSTTRVDHLFAVWLDACYADDGHYTYACWAFHGLLFHYPHLQQHLPLSAQRIDGWKKLAISSSVSHPPLTWELTCVIAVLLSSWHDHAAAMCVLLGFHCYHRISELIELRYHDIALPRDVRLGGAHTQMAIRIAKAKTGENQFISITDTCIAELFVDYLSAHSFQADDRVFPFRSSNSLRACFRLALSALNLDSCHYVFHSLRHGGATSDYL